MLSAEGEFEVKLATLEKKGSLLEEAVDAGFREIPEYKLNSFLSFGFFSQLWNCRRYLRENEISLIHTHDFYTNVFGMFAGRLAGVPVRVASKRETRGIRTPLQEKLERVAYRFATAVTVNAKAVEKYLAAAGVPPGKIHLTYNGIDLERLEPGTTDREGICAEIGIPPDKRFVTLVANLRHGVKNQPMLLRCAQKLRDEYPDVHFVFAGEGERKRFLIELSRKLGVEDRCHFIDRCRKVPELLYVSDVCVLTSFAEGFSNSILEYMAAGKPVVATDVGGARECIVDGKSGFLVASDDATAMSKRLAELLKDPELAARFGSAGREIVEGRFSLEIQLQEIKSLYRSLLGNQ